MQPLEPPTGDKRAMTDARKIFYVGGPINTQQHYHVRRAQQIVAIAKSLTESNYVLLHAHRQSGKSSIIKPTVTFLSEKINNSLSVCVSLQGLDEIDFWMPLSSRVTAACSSLARFRNGGEFMETFMEDKFPGAIIWFLTKSTSYWIRHCLVKAFRRLYVSLKRVMIQLLTNHML